MGGFRFVRNGDGDMLIVWAAAVVGRVAATTVATAGGLIFGFKAFRG